MASGPGTVCCRPPFHLHDFGQLNIFYLDHYDDIALFAPPKKPLLNEINAIRVIDGAFF